MTGQERRQQLLDIGRRLFAERGFEGTSIEEIAAQAGVSKPVVYEHFGGKEGLYAVVVDREVERLTTITMTLLDGKQSRPKFEAAAVTLLRYIEDNADGFRILVRDSSPGATTGTTSSSPVAGTRSWPRCTPRCSSAWWRSLASGGWTPASPRSSRWPRTLSTWPGTAWPSWTPRPEEGPREERP
jgi:AcrR family transcriptional regulator